MLDLSATKKRYSVIEVAQNILGLQLQQISSDEWRGISIAPGPHSTNDALSVTRDEWFDFSAGYGGSVLDLVAFVKFGNNEKHSICEAAKFLTGNDYDSGYWQKYSSQRDNFRTNVDKWHEALLADTRTLEYLYERKITDETIRRFKLGLAYEWLTVNGSPVQEWRLACPYLDGAGNPIYMASRRLDWCAHEDSPKYHKAKQNDFLRNTVFGMNTIPKNDNDCDILIIGEGMFDALSMAQEGYPIQFSIGGFAGKENDALILQTARRFRRILTCYDSDSSGQNFTIQQGKKFLSARLNFACITDYGSDCKDVSDYYTAGRSIPKLIDKAGNGYEFMSRYTFWDKQKPKKLSEYFPFYSLSANEKAKSLGEVKKFMYTLRGFLPDYQTFDVFGGDMRRVIEALAEYYPRNTIAKFEEGPTAQEKICFMRDEFLEERNLFYYGSIKHGEYWQYDNEGGYWYRMTDADLQHEIYEFFHEPDNKTIAQLTTQIRTACTHGIMPKFNKACVQVFTNGTLELNTGILREHRAEDFMTWSHNFPYDENTTCPAYDTFIQQVTANEQSRIDFLDDLAAYTMYEDCRLEKMFILIGEGMNGKGVFLHTLEALFNSSNERGNTPSITNIQPKDFDKPTQRIMLEGSMLNIAHDISHKLKDCESYLKSITSGDTIDGNRKFCDSHSFAPRTKIVCSSNHMIEVNDDSYGMRRRLMFCKFTTCFESNPDTTLRSKLIAELPGIFNRVYRAYQALREREKTQGNKAIRESIDQREFISEFTNITNPVAAFWQEHGQGFIEQQEVPKAEIFDKYRGFCERNGLFAGRENIFHGSLRKVLRDCNINFDTTRHREKINGEGKQSYYYTFSTEQTASKLQQLIDTGSLEIDDEDKTS